LAGFELDGKYARSLSSELEVMTLCGLSQWFRLKR